MTFSVGAVRGTHAVTDRRALFRVLQKLLARMREGEDEDRANKERERNMCRLTLFGVHPVLKTTVSNAFHVHKDMTLEDATELGWKVRLLAGVTVLSSRCTCNQYRFVASLGLVFSSRLNNFDFLIESMRRRPSHLLLSQLMGMDHTF